MARSICMLVALTCWLLDLSLSQNGCEIDYICRRAEEQCLTMENVALGKMAEISSFYIDPKTFSPPACLVVNGNINNWFAGNVRITYFCAHTNSTDYTGWWQVHLGRNYTIKDITVYSQDLGYRLSEVRVTIDGELCYDFPNRTSNDELSDISCNTPLTGSTVRFEKRRRASDDAYYLVLCEVEIWGLFGPLCDKQCSGYCKENDTCDNYYGTCPRVCRPGLYGPSCGERCNCKHNDTCNNYYGTCPNDCADGYYSANCSRKCGQCLDVTCHNATGQCMSGCQSGWTGQYCTQSCPDYYYGPNCANKCGHCLRNGTCNTTTGECHQGCDPGWTSVLCNQMCPIGNYGQNCNATCGFCASPIVSCDPVIGHCPNGCQTGYQPPLCDKSCSHNTYGQNCNRTCGHCESFPCNTVTGQCVQCQRNFAPPLCDECQIGWFGESCSQICVNCDGDHSCHRNTGLCAHGCQVGWEPINCSTQCKPGTFGKSCQENCGNCQNSACRYDNGFCELGCVDHYEGNLCKAAKVPVPTIVAAVVPCAVLLTAVGIVFILWRIRRKRKQNTTSGSVELPVKPQECNSPSESQMVSEDVSETVHSYDTLQTGTAETSPYSAPVFREYEHVTKEESSYYNT